MITCTNSEGQVERFKNVKAILRFINSDHSSEFRKYTKHDWKDGLCEETRLTLVSTR